MMNWTTKDVIKMISDEQEFYRGQATMANKMNDFERESACWDRVLALRLLGERFVDSDETLMWEEQIDIKAEVQ